MSDTRRGLIEEARRKFVAAGIETAALDARLLFQHANGVTHEDIIADPDTPAQRFDALIARRLAHEPVSRILGEREFYGRRFIVTPAVLDPRPDTETLIEAVLPLKPKRILDLGTGSGAIAVTLLAELPAATATATDISRAALDIAAANAAALGVAGRFRAVHGSWFDPVEGRFDLIVSNPPYIPLADIAALDPEVQNHDPLRALDGGPDGLEAYRRIAVGAHGRVAVEIGAGQAEAVTGIFETAGFGLESRHLDLGNHVRVLIFCDKKDI